MLVERVNKVLGYRKMLGLRQRDMAEQLGISVQAFSNKERGITPYTDKEKIILLKLFKKLDSSLTIDEVFFN